MQLQLQVLNWGDTALLSNGLQIPDDSYRWRFHTLARGADTPGEDGIRPVGRLVVLLPESLMTFEIRQFQTVEDCEIDNVTPEIGLARSIPLVWVKHVIYDIIAKQPDDELQIG